MTHTNVLAGLVARALVPIVLAVSAGYVFVYLYRWEWNRALISGLFFLVAEVAYVGSSLHREIRVLADRTAALEATARDRLHSRLGESDVRPARSFGWLRDSVSGAGTNVFVPVLLGAGVIFSAAAFVVERVAGAVARSTVDRTSARHLAGLEPLPHGLLGRPTPSAGPRRRRARWLDTAGRVGAVAIVVVMIGAAVDLLADATQSRPTPVRDGTSTVIELEVAQRRSRPVLDAAEALVIACRGALTHGTEVERVMLVADDHVELVVQPGLSEPRRRRYFGCLEDTTLDLIQARVSSWHG
jgi:hypothetical protein